MPLTVTFQWGHRRKNGGVSGLGIFDLFVEIDTERIPHSTL